MSKEKAIEICNNLEQTIHKAMIQIEKINNPMFSSPTVSKQKLESLRNKLIKDHNLTKKDLK